ncbi:MAG: NUDIX hydrolase [Clostridia bacterium]|nr:NUDIX hydrolase [Clostridia bacterium]
MSDYIKTIRKKVGHDPVLQCGASVIVVNERGELLLQQRSDNGSWGYHGGSVELGEEVEMTARRELQEETGLIAGHMTLLGVFSGEGMHWVYPNEDEVYNVDVVYVCREFEGELNPQKGEVTALRWFAPHQLPENIFPMNRKALDFYLQHSE